MREHWHSPDQPTMDARFSFDGNSIMSGGQEAGKLEYLFLLKTRK